MCITLCNWWTDQTEYVRGDMDDMSTKPADYSCSDTAYTQLVTDGMLTCMLQMAHSDLWVFHCASGGCVTAVTLARGLLQHHQHVLGIIADSGVPGSDPALPRRVPVYVFRALHDSWWPGRDRLFQIWEKLQYEVDFRSEGQEWQRHAGVVADRCMLN